MTAAHVENGEEVLAEFVAEHGPISGPAGAWESSDGRLRHLLWRRWESGKPWAGWVMLNPSTAGARDEDPTLRRVFNLTQRIGIFGGLLVANLYPVRETDSKKLGTALEGAIKEGIMDRGMMEGQAGRGVVALAHMVATAGGKAVAAWGGIEKAHRAQADAVLRVLYRAGLTPLCVGYTDRLCPRHPLYVSRNTPFYRYRHPHCPFCGRDLSALSECEYKGLGRLKGGSQVVAMRHIGLNMNHLLTCPDANIRPPLLVGDDEGVAPEATSAPTEGTWPPAVLLDDGTKP